MSDIKIPVGRSSFADIRRNGYYFIDKSLLIEELLKTDATQVTLITRPRRFGKTLVMSMLSEFFDIQKDSREFFEGLSISNSKELCEKWMNQYPTLFLSFRSVEGLDFDKAYSKLAAVVAQVFTEQLYLLDSEKINTYEKAVFDRVASKSATREEVENSLLLLTRMMEAHYGRPVILLIDEYDVPLAKANENGYYPEMLDVIRGIVQVVKDNDSLKFAVITGCLRIAKESIFTGTNNLVADTISDARLNEYFGFTQREVDKLLVDTGLVSHAGELKKWYDGYRFGNCSVYCPWDVMNYVKDLMLDPKARPVGYWKNSSDNAVIRSFIDYSGDIITKKLETLLSGGYIIQRVKNDLTYDYLHSSEENLWSVLYLTGYLTQITDIEEGKEIAEDSLALIIPNMEVREIFESVIKIWFEESSRTWNRKALFAAVWNGNAGELTREMTKLLRKTISYHDYGEDFYHAFLAGIFAGAGYVVESNREHGEGRSDIVVQDYAGDRVAVFEVKYSKSQAGLIADCEDAVRQINDRSYAKEYEEDYTQVLCYGISFFKKRCSVLLKGQPAE